MWGKENEECCVSRLTGMHLHFSGQVKCRGQKSAANSFTFVSRLLLLHLLANFTEMRKILSLFGAKHYKAKVCVNECEKLVHYEGKRTDQPR